MCNFIKRKQILSFQYLVMFGFASFSDGDLDYLRVIFINFIIFFHILVEALEGTRNFIFFLSDEQFLDLHLFWCLVQVIECIQSLY